MRLAGGEGLRGQGKPETRWGSTVQTTGKGSQEREGRQQQGAGGGALEGQEGGRNINLQTPSKVSMGEAGRGKEETSRFPAWQGERKRSGYGLQRRF